MGTNYYLRHKPSREDLMELITMIDHSKSGHYFNQIIRKVHELYDEYNEFKDGDGVDWGVLHLGKRSGGWKFQWCPNLIRRVEIDNTKKGGERIKTYYEFRYPLTRDGIKEFIMKKDVEIFDEYGQKCDKTEFLEMAFSWYPKGLDSVSYAKKDPRAYKFDQREEQEKYKKLGFGFTEDYQSDFESDGLRWSILDDFS